MYNIPFQNILLQINTLSTVISPSSEATRSTDNNLSFGVGGGVASLVLMLLVTTTAFITMTVYVCLKKEKEGVVSNTANGPSTEFSMAVNIAHDESYTVAPQFYSYASTTQPTVAFMTLNNAYNQTLVQAPSVQAISQSIPGEGDTRGNVAHVMCETEVEMLPTNHLLVVMMQTSMSILTMMVQRMHL